MDLAVKEINEAGGINGIQIEYNFQDDEHDPEKAVNGRIGILCILTLRLSGLRAAVSAGAGR